MKTVPIKDIFPRLLRVLGGQGDALFLAAAGFVVVYAAFLFLTRIYLPVFAVQPPPPEKSIFNTKAFDRVIDRIASIEERRQEYLANMPVDPFPLE